MHICTTLLHAHVLEQEVFVAVWSASQNLRSSKQILTTWQLVIKTCSVHKFHNVKGCLVIS